MPQQRNGPSWKERRKYPRLSRSMPVTLLDGAKRLLDMDSKLVDMSRNGLGFITSSPHNTGETILFRLEIPGEGLVAGSAVLRWCREDPENSRYISGAEIRSFAWGHSSKLRRFLGRGSGYALENMDFFLIAACVAMGLLIIQDKTLLAHGTVMSQRLITDLFTWFPQAGVIAVSLIGIYVLLRHQ